MSKKNGDNTPNKHLPQELIDNEWQKGQSGNPAGRPKGTRTKFSETFLKAFLEDFEAHGKDAIKEVRKKDPSTYLRVAVSIVPKQVSIEKEATDLDKILEQLSDTELEDAIKGLTVLGIASQKGTAQKGAKEQPSNIH